jgi:hypothetical protein
MKNLLILILSLHFASCSEDSSAVIETLDGDKLTVKKFEQAYETAIESMSRMQNIEKENLIKIISQDKEEVAQAEPFYRQIHDQFQKKNFYDNYRNMVMVKKAADKAGFTSRNDIKNIVSFLEMQTISQLFITEEIEKRIKITEEEAQKTCVEFREKNAQIKSLTADKCVQWARAYLKSEQSKDIVPKVYERIKEGISIKHNDKFDLEQYLKSIPSFIQEKTEPKK